MMQFMVHPMDDVNLKSLLMRSFLDSWSVAGELSLDLMQRLSAADLEDMLKVTPPSTHHNDEYCCFVSSRFQSKLLLLPGLWS